MKFMNKVLHIVNSLGMGGAETWLVELIRYIKKNQKNDFEIEILVTNGNKDIFDDELKGYGVRIFYVKFDKNTIFKFTRNFRKILRDNDYVAVHDHQDLISAFHFLLGINLLPRKRLVHFHNPIYQMMENYGSSVRRKIQLKIGYFLLKYISTHLLGTSKELLKEYKVFDSYFKTQTIEAFHCAFSIDKYNFLPNLITESKNDTVNILFVGRFDYSILENHPQNHKNSTFAIRVFSMLPRTKYKLKMAGANEYIKDEVLSLIHELGIQEDVELLGIRNDIPDLMKSHDLLFFPSRAEGLGMVAVEAQAANLMVLASSTVPKECVVIKEFVRFKNLNDSHQSWADEIIRLTDKEKIFVNHQDNRWINSSFNMRVSYKNLKCLYLDES